ncbi:MAG: PAS domain S-box protein, partial [Sphaerochaetaceae bacterium]|nr:PAS domain S-box protein [Sphaerochaetaceae bacterium]
MKQMDSRELEYPGKLFDALPDGVLTVANDGRILRANTAVCTMLGYDSTSLSDMNIRDLECDGNDSGFKVSKALQQLSDGESTVLESVLCTNNGQPIDIEVSLTCIGEVSLEVVCIIRNISRHKRVESSLTYVSDLMEYVIEHTRSSIAVHDRNLRYMYVSQRYLDEYHITDPHIIGKHHYEVIPDLPQKWRDVHQRCLAGEILSAEEDPFTRSDGTMEWARW